jgi:hypothetical protein
MGIVWTRPGGPFNGQPSVRSALHKPFRQPCRQPRLTRLELTDPYARAGAVHDVPFEHRSARDRLATTSLSHEPATDARSRRCSPPLVVARRRSCSGRAAQPATEPTDPFDYWGGCTLCRFLAPRITAREKQRSIARLDDFHATASTRQQARSHQRLLRSHLFLQVPIL